MTPLDLQSERVSATGNLASEGVLNQLGRPRLDPLTVLVREAVQNSWDARSTDSTQLLFGLSSRTLSGPQVRLLRDGARPPQRTRPGDAGYDLACCQDFELEPGESAKVPTGFALAVPDGVVGLVCPRSGLAASSQVTVVNGPGVVDANFRGECCVLLINLGKDRFVARAGDRIARPMRSAMIKAAATSHRQANASNGTASRLTT